MTPAAHKRWDRLSTALYAAGFVAWVVAIWLDGPLASVVFLGGLGLICTSFAILHAIGVRADRGRP